MEAEKACQNYRYKELLKKGLCEPEDLDKLREAMLAAAKEGRYSISVPIEEAADKKWRSAYAKDYRSPSKRRFDQDLSEFLTLHFEGVFAKAAGQEVHFSWRYRNLFFKFHFTFISPSVIIIAVTI
jgi:hypothetical protein